MNRPSPDGTPLSEIARALGVPVSSFFSVGLDEAALTMDRPDGAAVLALVRSYLLLANPEARRRFEADVRVMVESMSR